MAENIYHKNPNTESPLFDKTGTPSVGATNNAQSVPTFERDQYLTPYNEIEKGEQANVEPTQKVETPTTPEESPLSPSVETPKEETPKAEAEPMKFDIPTIKGYTEKPTAPTLTTAETSAVSTPIRKSHKNFFDEYMDVAIHNLALARTQGRTASQIFADMAKRLTPEGMVQSFSEMNAMRLQARLYADAMSTTATDYGIEKTLSEKMSGWKSDRKLFDADEILKQLEKTDGDGNKFYQFYGGEIYGDAARKIVKRYVDEHNHWVNMADKDYRERWSMAKYGIPYEEFVDRRYEESLHPRLQKLREAQSAYYNSDEYEMQEEWRRNLSSLDDGFGTPDKDDNLALATQTTFARANSFKDATFANGLIEGMFPAIKSMLPGGVGALDDAALMSEQVIALDKTIKGEPLSKREEYLVALWEANEIIDEETNLYRKGGNWAKTASTGLQGIGFSAGIATSGAQRIGNMLGKKLLGEAAEQSGLKILKEQGFKTAIKMTAKAAPKKLAVSATTSAVKAGVSSMTARNFAEDRLDQFKMTQLGLMKEEKNPLASLWKAYAMSFGEWFTEDLGDVADDIMALGRRAALNKAFSGKLSKALTRLDDFKATSAVRNFLRDARIQGLTAEAGSELLNNYIQPLLTGEFFWDISQDGFMSAANKHYSDVLTWESTWDTITQSAIIAGTGMMSRGISGAMQGWQISSLRNQIRETLGDVQNEGLRNQLYELINSDTPNFAPLAGINWKSEGINVGDAQRAMQVVFKSAQVQEMRGEFEETQRLAAFAPQLQYILQRAYKGVDIAAPTETLEEIEIKKGDDTLGYVLYGDVDSPNQVLQIVDGNGQVHNIATESLKADGYEFKRKSIGDAISEQYALMFSNQISQERLGDVIESVRGYRGADAETKQRIIEANGFSVYKNGAAVTLVDGRMAVVKGNAENGQYTVDILGADGKVADTAMVGFEYILNENDPNMAQAQMDAQARGALGSPIVLPTKEGGRISLDEINDSQTLADLLPSQVGGKAKAVAVIDAETERLKAMQDSQSKKVGLDAVADNVQQAEVIANRIAVLEDTRKRLGGAPKAQPKTREEVAKENEAKQAERDGMSTFEFSQDYRRRMGNTKVSRNALKTFINSIDEGLAVLDETLKDNEAAIAKKEAEISNAFSRATSEVDLERIAEEQKTAVAKLNTLKAERAEMEADRKKMQHRKAQYEQALKDMGGNTDTKYQEGTIGADKRVFDFAKKASEILGMPVVVSENEFTSNRQNGVHRVDEDGKSYIYINPESTAAEQGVGILAHEIVHELKTVLNKKEWAKLETYIMGAAFGRKWRGSKGYQSLIDSIQAAERRSGHKEGISDDKAREEAVAYTIQDLIFAGERGMKAMEAIFADPDTKWTEKVRTVFKNLLAKIKALFSSSNDQKLQEAIKVFEESLHRVEDKKKAGYNYAKRAKKDASGKESHSLATFNDWVDDRGVAHKGTRTMFIERMNANGFSDEQKADMIARMDTAYEYMVKLQEFTDEDGNVRFDAFNEWAKTTPHYKQIGLDYVKAITSLVSNGDYPINLELTTDCIKREAFTALVNELAKRGVNMGAMRPAQIMVLQNMMQQYGIEVACKLCFVEGKRLGIVNWAETIVQDWNDALVEAGIETDEYFDFGKDGEVVVPTTPLREIERGHEQKVAWDAIFEVDLIMEGRDPKAFKEQMRKNLKAVEEYKKQRAEEWANKTKKPRNPADWKPTKDDQKHIDELMSQGVTVAQVGKNASEYREAFNRMRDAWIEKNPKKDPLSFNPTKKQWDALDKIRNREIATVKAKMVRLIMEHPEMRKKMQLKDLLGSKGLMDIRNQDGEAFADLWSIILQRFGTGTPKPIQDATPYDGEIMGLTESQFDKANKIGGARLFSFSDFDITKIFDYMQMFFDLEANKQMLQSYTKEVPAVIALGRSNAKINISTLANADVPAEVKEQYEKANADGKKALRHKMSENAGLLLDEDGNIVGINFSKEHSVKPEFAQDIFHDDTRNKDCGAIMVGDSVNHAIYSAAQDWIRMVIPFHLSGIPLAAREKADTLWYFDNTPYQSTRKRSGEEGWTKLGTADKDFEFYNDMDKKGWNMRDKAREYIAWCEARGYRPKFDWGINSDYYRAFCEQEGFTPNQQIIDMMDADTTDGVWNQYYKFLTDFTAYKPVFNEKGEMIDEIPSPQLPVKATFDFSEMEREVLFEGEDSMLAHREGNIKRTQEHIGELADKATAFLLGDVTEEGLGLRDDVHYENYADAEKYLEAKANSLQKQPNTQEVVTDADVEESYSISRNNEATIDKWLGKREDFTDEVKSAFKEYIADFKPATQLATTKWYANGVIRIPEDMPKVEQAMEIAQRKKVDALQYNSPMELIDQFGDVFKPKAKLINPDDVPTLSNKVQVPNTDITIYDVEDSEESRKNFRELMNSHLGKDANPWCLMQAEDGVLRADSKDYWEKYNKYQRRAAFKGGKLIAFFASDGEPTWWDRMDQPHDHIPIVGKIKGDELGRTATLLYNEENGEMMGYDDIRKGARGDAYYAEWYDLDTMKEESRYDKATGNGSERYFYEDGSVELYKVIEADREMQRVHFDRQGNVTSQTESNGWLDYSSVWQDGAKQKISIDGRGQYLRIEWDGSDVKGLDYTWQGKREVFTFETNAYKSEETNLQKRYLLSYGSNEWMFRRSKLLRVTTNKEYKAAIFVDRTSVEIKNVGENSTTTLERLPVGDGVYYINITNSHDGQHEKVDIENIGSINDGVRVLNEGVTDALVDEIMAEVKQRLDIVDRVASDINKDSEMQRKRSAKLAQMYHPDNVSDVRSLDEANILLDKARVDITSTRDSFSIDRSQSAEEVAEPRTEQESFSLVKPTDEEVTFDDFYTNTSVVFEKVGETPTRRPDFVSKSRSKYWYGEDEGGKYVIRQSDHWSANVTTEEAKDAFNAKPDNYSNIASCYWALEGAVNQPTTIKLGTIDKTNVQGVDYNTETHRLTIILKGGRRVYRDGVAVRDMRKYFNLMKSQGATAANDYVVDMVNEKYAEVVKPADKVQIGKAYLTDFTKWEVEPRESFSVLREEAKLKDGVRAILDEYNNEGIQYRSEIDIANGIEALINDYEGDAAELENILNDFRMAQDDARAWGNRMDAGGEEVFMDTLNAWVNSKGDVSESYSLSRERADIERKAKADGTWLKAPNGKETNLSPEQWVTVRTKAFKEWFGDWENDPENASKIVDENGEPKVVYHQTNGTVYINRETGENWDELDWQAKDAWDERDDWEEYWEEQDFYTFSRVNARITNELDGFFFAPEYDEYHEYGKRTIPAFLNIRKPASSADYRVDATYNNAGRKERIRLQNEGYDGVINAYDGVIDEYIAFEPNQIKSATENIGTFDSANDDIRYSLNRDDVTIATPEMEAEANEELSKEAKLLAELDDAQNAYDRLVRKLKAVAERKELTFDEVRKFLLDESVMEGLQEASAGQYRRIIRNVLNVLEKTPNKRIKIESLANRIQEELLSARLNVANSALKAAGKDFKKLITKKREGRNTRGEAIAKYVDNETRKAVGLFVDIIEYAYKNSDGKVMWDNALLAGRAFGEGVVTIDKVLDDDEINGETLPAITRNLLFVYKYLRNRAVDVDTALNNQQSTASEIEQVETKIATLQKLVETFKAGGRGFGDALRELKAMGYRTIPVAENAIENLYATRKALRKEMRDHKNAEARAKNQLVQAIKYMNTAIVGVDKKGRVALKAEQAEKKERQGKFKSGIFRSVRSPHYKNVGYKEEYIDEMSYGKRRNIRRRGKVFWPDVAETLEFLSRRIDRMSIPNEWLQDGWYYQFILHPTEGVLARADWRYKTEKALREQLNEKARELFAPDKKKGEFTIDDLKYNLKSKSGITVEILKTSVTGKPQHKAVKQTIELTLGQLLYVRAMNAQEGGILGLITNGLTPSKVAQIVEYAEREYPQFCEFDDWIRGEDGILEQIYQIRNEIYRSINGVDLDHTEGYFPIQRKSDEVNKEEDVGNAINVATIAGGIGSNKKRVRNSVPIDITVDYFEKLDQHISESIQWCAAAELIEKMNVLLSSKQFRQILEAQGFDKEAIKNSFKRAIGERLQTTEGKETSVDRVVTSISKNMVAANVAFNLNSALKQLVSLSASFSNEFNLKLLGYFARNLFLPSALMSDIKDMDLWNKDDSHFEKVVSLAKLRGCHRWAKENIPTYAERVDSANMGYDIFEQDGIDSWDRLSNWFKEKGMKANVYMDSVACAVLTKTYYDYQYERNKERGMSHQEAHDDARMRAANIMNQTQQSSQGAYMSKYQADKLIGAQAFTRAFFMAYQNSQLGFDRNARAAYQNLATMMYDIFGKGKGNSMKLMIKYQSDQYIARGIKKSEARKMAVADYRRSFFTQLNTLLHNMVLNNVLWTASSVLSANIARMMAAIGLMFKGSDYDDEPTEITFEAIWDDVKQELRKSWWLYAIPYSQTVLAKSFVDTAAGAMTATDANSFKAQHTIGGQVINDLLGSIQKAITSFDYASDEEKKAQTTLVVLGLIDAVSRVGFGISTRTLTRMIGGVAGIAGDGEAEHYMNLFSSPRYLTKAVAGRPRKGETMKQYTERLGGAYKIINGNLKGEDTSKLRKQYIDRMDELMFYGTDFDYDAFKELEKWTKRKDARLPLKSDGTIREGVSAPTAEEAWRQMQMHAQKARANSFKNTLQYYNNWDEEGAKDRKKFYEKQLNALEAFKKISETPQEELIPVVSEITYQQTYDDYLDDNINKWGYKKRTENEIERRSKKAAREIASDREEYITDYNARLNEQNK